VHSFASILRRGKVETIEEDRPRYKRTIETAYQSAFQLIRYAALDGSEMLVWNSRDGEVPSRFTFDGREYRYRTAQTDRSTILPDKADLVITSYTREQWNEWSRISWEAACARDPDYLKRTPTLARFMQVAPFEHGMVRIVTRHQYLHETNEWQGRLGR